MDGELLTQTWSIGGPQPASTLGGLLGKPQGISYSHNKYKGDTSIGRSDDYLNNGDAHSLNVTRFKQVYELGLDDDRYTLDKFRINSIRNQKDSVILLRTSFLNHSRRSRCIQLRHQLRKYFWIILHPQSLASYRCPTTLRRNQAGTLMETGSSSSSPSRESTPTSSGYQARRESQRTGTYDPLPVLTTL
jgi:hypothetical protein